MMALEYYRHIFGYVSFKCMYTIQHKLFCDNWKHVKHLFCYMTERDELYNTLFYGFIISQYIAMKLPSKNNVIWYLLE